MRLLTRAVAAAAMAAVATTAAVDLGTAAAGRPPAAEAASSDGTDAPTSRPAVRPTTAAPGVAAATSALAALRRLPVKGRAPRTGYSRDRFGPAWSDDVAVAFGHDGCDTRNDVLARDLTGVTFRAGTRGCVVLSGTLRDPYSGRTIRFVRGPGTSTAVQVDHVVALSNAWQTGAQKLTGDRRRDLANDPLNLVSVDGPTNQRKGDGDAATWLPPDKRVRCAYVARQVAVKARYGLWVTAAEKAAVARVLGGCPAQAVPADGTRRLVPGGPAPSTSTRTTATRTSTPTPTTTTSGSGPDPRFATCAAARAAGYGPYRRGVDPEYAWYRDGDGDGDVCE